MKPGIEREINVRKHTVRIISTMTDYGSGCYRPGIRLFLRGPNGSAAGIGPKAWPLHTRIRNFRNFLSMRTGFMRKKNGQYRTWTNALYIPVPHIRWSVAYRFRYFGAMWIYVFVSKFWKRYL